MLREMGIDRVIFDSRPLFSAPPTNEIEQAAQTRKPKVPVRTEVTGSNQILRLIGRNDVSAVQPWVNEWSETIYGWFAEGKSPYVFAHTPDDAFAPKLAKMLSEKLNTTLGQTSIGQDISKVQQMLF